MIIQSLGSTGYLSLFYSRIAHSITLAHPGYSYKQTGGRWMVKKFIPKGQEKGGRRCGYSKH